MAFVSQLIDKHHKYLNLKEPSVNVHLRSRNKVYSLVMTSCHFKLAKEYVSIAKITVCPPLSRLIPKLFSNEKTLPNSRVQSNVRSGLTGNILS